MHTGRGHPLVDQGGVLPLAHVVCGLDPAREGIVLDSTAAPFEPGQQARPHVAGDLELDRPSRLLLNDDRARPDLRSGDQIANPDLDQVAAAKLAVDCQIEQGAVTNTSLTIEEEANSPDLLLCERTLGSHFLSCVPSYALTAIVLRVAHVSSPRP